MSLTKNTKQNWKIKKKVDSYSGSTTNKLKRDWLWKWEDDLYLVASLSRLLRSSSYKTHKLKKVNYPIFKTFLSEYSKLYPFKECEGQTVVDSVHKPEKEQKDQGWSLPKVKHSEGLLKS